MTASPPHPPPGSPRAAPGISPTPAEPARTPPGPEPRAHETQARERPARVPAAADDPDETRSAGSAAPAAGEERRIDPDRIECERAARGDRAAFEELVRRHQDRVYTRIYFMVRDRETAADLTQEALLRAWRGLPSFRGESLFSTWLARVAVNVTRHHFERIGAQKRRAREISIHASTAEDGRDLEIPDRKNLPEEWAMRGEKQRRILEAVAELDPVFRMALALRELHGRSYQEIGEELGLPIGTVKSKIFRARQQLQEKLRDLL
jgi:RNA polymerase sigma-70 factor (ECF subfamily)